MKKKETPEVLWLMDLYYNENKAVKYPTLYDVIKRENRFVVRYHGVCDIHTSNSLDSAVDWIHSHLQKWKDIVAGVYCV